jgi:hypothetical protein
MFSKFPLFQNHLDLAHQYWKAIIQPGDTVIDATCGNGHDTLELALLTLGDEMKPGRLLAFDCQQTAIDQAKTLLAEKLPEGQLSRIEFILGCHSVWPEDIAQGSVRAIVYNLGYLPGGDKSLTTQTATTLESIKKALPLLMKGGMICVACYPGHAEGKIEEEAILELVKGLNAKSWSVCHHRWLNRQNAPSLLVIQAAI